MKKNRRSAVLPIFWSAITVLWIVLFCLGLSSGTESEGLIVMRALCMLASLAAAIMNWIRYKAN